MKVLVSATFTPDVYTITAAADVNGSITPQGAITVNKGDSLTFTITPAAGFEVRVARVPNRSDIFFDPSFANSSVTRMRRGESW